MIIDTSHVLGHFSQNNSILISPKSVCSVTDMIYDKEFESS